MPSSYTAEMRERVIARVESGASRREAAEHFEISPSAAVKWLQRWHDDGSATAIPRGGSTSPLEKHANWLLALSAASVSEPLPSGPSVSAKSMARRPPFPRSQASR